MTDAILSAIEASREREKKACEAPWHFEVYENIKAAKREGGFGWCSGELPGRPADIWYRTSGGGFTGLPGSIETTEENAAFISSARTMEPRFREALAFAVQELRDIGGKEGPEALTRIAAILEGKP